jgi:hypothetical protein
MSVRLHYPEVFDGSLIMDLIILMIGHSGWSGMRIRDILQRGRLRIGDKLPLDNSMTSENTHAAYPLIISLRRRRQRKLSICLEE